MKVALCFNIHYKNSLVKEKIWKEWIYYNRDIINVYFHYKKNTPISSSWIKKHCIPLQFIKETSYFHVVPALMSLLSFAYKDSSNRWFCLLTDSCVPIMSPIDFRNFFIRNYSYSIFHWYIPNWNINYHRRANLEKIPKKYHLANDPWFIISRHDVLCCLRFTKEKIYQIIIRGIIANESVFAIALAYFSRLQNVINQSSSLCDWSRMSSPTSPFVFKYNPSEKDKKLIMDSNCVFMRKVHHTFSDTVLEEIIYPSSFKRTKYTEKQLNILYRSSFPFFRVFLFCFCFFCSFPFFTTFAFT